LLIETDEGYCSLRLTGFQINFFAIAPKFSGMTEKEEIAS